jgi:hypothetical protein
MKQWIAVVLICAMGNVQVGLALAQTSAPPDTAAQSQPAPAPAPTTGTTPATESSKPDVNDCIESGRNDGRHADTGGSFVGGLFGGLLLGVIGTGIAYVAQGEPDPPTTARYAKQGAECRMAYSDAFGEQGKKRKRSAALTGGLLGTAVWIVVIAAASSSE